MNLQINFPWTESPFFEEALQKSDYDASTKDKIRFFSQNGYLILHPEIENFPSLAATIVQDLSEEQKKTFRVQDAWRYQRGVKELACHEEILKWLKILYIREPIPFQTLNFSRGTEQATHSDAVHFNSAPERFMAGVWFALEDVDENNGALHYYPGSHKLPIYDLHTIGLSKSTLKNRTEHYQKYEKFIASLIRQVGLKKETIAMKKGSCLIWSANLFHGGNPIRDKSRTRHTLVTHYYFEGCRYYTPLYSDPFNEDIAWKQILNIKTGQIVPHLYNGKKISLPLKTRCRYFLENTLRNNSWGRNLFHKAKFLLMKR